MNNEHFPGFSNQFPNFCKLINKYYVVISPILPAFKFWKINTGQVLVKVILPKKIWKVVDFRGLDKNV